MNGFERIIYALQAQMERPTSYGLFHIVWIALTIISIIVIVLNRKKFNEKQMKTFLLTYGIIAFILELLKQIVWSFNYDAALNIVTWDYQWYAAPFQLCTTPIFASLIAGITKNKNLRDYMISFMMFFTILGSISTFVYPESCFTKDILINIHTMFLHCGSLVVSIYLLLNRKDLFNSQSLSNGFIVLLIFILIALVLDVSFYRLGIIGNETFNMFYISPYFTSSLPVFDYIQEHTPYYLFLLIYIGIMLLGGTIIYFIFRPVNK